MNRLLLILVALGTALACSNKRVDPPPVVEIQVKAGEATILDSPASPAPALTGAALTTVGLLIPRNDDDSNGDGTQDFMDSVVNGMDDARQLAVLTIKRLTSTPKSGDVLHLRKKAGVGQVRVFRNEVTPSASNSILDSAAAAQTTTAEATTTIQRAKEPAGTSFYVEGKAAGDVELCVTWTGSASVEACVKLEVRDGLQPVIYGDHDRNGTLNAADIPLRDMAAKSALIFVNNDRDCDVGPPTQRDFGDASIGCPGPGGAADEADIGHITVPVAPLASLPAGWKAVVRVLSAKAGALRVFAGTTSGTVQITGLPVTVNARAMSEMDLTTPLAAAVGAAKTDFQLGVEGREFAVDLELFLCVVHGAGRVDAACDRMKVSTGRVLLQSNSERVSTVVVGDMGDNAPVVSSLGGTGALPAPATLSTLLTADHLLDRWLQDEVEIGGQATPRGNAQVVLHLPRNRGLAAWAQKQLGADVAYVDLRHKVPAAAIAAGDTSVYGGNLEVSPATPGSQGRMIVGDNIMISGSGLVTELGRLSPDQGPAIDLDVSWLVVGHVDEVMAFFPQGGAIGIAVADTSVGKAVLAAAPERAGLFWHCRTAGRTRESGCFGSGTITSATTKSGATPAKLKASGFTFNARPAGREWSWIRIYSGTGRGQIAHIGKIIDANNVELDFVWNLPTPDMARCAATHYPALCDRAATGLGAPILSGTLPFWPGDVFRRDDWFTVPTAGARFVVVEDTLDWDPQLKGSASKSAPTPPRGVPALITAGELRNPVSNKAFLDKQTIIGAILDGIASKLATLPGPPMIKRIPALYQVVDHGGTMALGEAFVPGVVNFQVVQGNTSTRVFAARPFGPSVGATDLWQTRCNMELGMTPTFVDDWDSYHIQFGEVHCGTNLFKAAAREWWK